MSNIFKLTIDANAMGFDKQATHARIVNQYVDVNDSMRITAPIDKYLVLSNGLVVVDMVPTTAGSVYQIILMNGGESLLDAYFSMPAENKALSEIDLHTAYPTRSNHPSDLVTWGFIQGSLDDQSDLFETIFTQAEAENLSEKVGNLVEVAFTNSQAKVLKKDIEQTASEDKFVLMQQIAINSAQTKADYLKSNVALQEQINSIGGGKFAYETYTQMIAASLLPLGDPLKIPANSSIDVVNDTPDKIGTYSYDGVLFTKSIYDPLSLAKADTTTKVKEAYSMTDRAVKDEKVSSAISKLPDDSEWAFALQSDQGVLGLKKSGEVVLPKPEITVGSAAISSFYDDAAFKLADKDGKIVFAVDKDGQPITSNGSAAKGKILTRVKKTEANKMSVYQKGSGTNYIEYNFERETFAFDGSSPSNNLDCWRIKGAYECSADYLRLRVLVDIGAWECAIKEDGAVDFIGTFHGDDVLVDAFFIINNKEYSQSSLFDIDNPSGFEFVQTSNLYSCNTQTKVASCYRHYQWFDNSVTVEQKITFVKPVVVKDAYLAMLPVKRTLDDTTQITDSGLRLYDGNVYHDPDMTTTSFSLNMTPASDGSLSKLWGKTSGVGFEVKMMKTPNLQNQDFYISNAALYNKFYFNAKGTGSAAGTYTTQTNEAWQSVIRFTVNTTN